MTCRRESFSALLLIVVASIATFAATPIVEWTQTFGSPQYEDLRDVVQTSDGGYAVYGTTASSGQRQLWLLKLDGQGNTVWERTYGGHGSETAWSMALTSDGGYILAGSQGTSEAPIEDSIVVYKIFGTGEKEWSHLMGFPFTLGPPLIYERVDGGFAVFCAATDHEGFQGIQPIFLDRDGSPGRVTLFIEAHLGYVDITSIKFTVKETSDGEYILRVPIKWGWIPLGRRSFKISPSDF